MSRMTRCLGAALAILSFSHALAIGGDWPFHRHKADPESPNSMVQIARSIDAIEERIRDDGIVVIKQPDVWGQARMTKYRIDFEKSMMENLKFEETLSAVISRADRAALESQTAIGLSLTPGGKAGGGVQVSNSAADDSGTGQAALVGAAQDMINKAKDRDGLNEFEKTETFKLLKDTSTLFKAKDAPVIGLEPTVLLEEKKTFYDRLNQYRRENFGDDNADSAGYNLYQFSLPVSIQPGEKTHRDHGAQLTVTVRHEFGPDFLAATFRDLVINDLVDRLTPFIFNLIRDDRFEKFYEERFTKDSFIEGGEMVPGPKKFNASRLRTLFKEMKYDIDQYLPNLDPQQQDLRYRLYNAMTQIKSGAQGASMKDVVGLVGGGYQQASTLTASRVQDEEYPVAPSDMVDVLGAEHLGALSVFAFKARQTKRPRAADVRAFLAHELTSAYDMMAEAGRDSLPMLADAEFLDEVARLVQSRDFAGLRTLDESYLPQRMLDAQQRPLRLQKAVDELLMNHPEWQALTSAPPLPPDPRTTRNPRAKTDEEIVDEIITLLPIRPTGPLCWAIAVDAALLNRRFREELREFNGVNGFQLDCDPEGLYFHLPMPKEPGGEPNYSAAQEVFENYTRARWPIVCFSVDPMNDQQNIADSFSRTRDLQLALAFAFSSGQIGFNQMLKYRRQLDYEAATIALNRTVSSFIQGNETFGWRFGPRYQTPPQEKSNLHVIANQVLFGGPPRGFQVKNSKLEAGPRELSAVVIMPSILQRVRMDVTSNWYRLSDPDETTLHTDHMLEQGRKVIELRQSLATACDSGRYRPDDLSRLMVKVDQLESMLPMQTKSVMVPYGNVLGGFDLFKKGAASLAPILIGYQGVDELTSESCRNAFLIFGKNFSIQETRVVAGGQRIEEADVEIISREVIRVRLAKNLELTTTRDGMKHVELHLGTPNGISNRLLLPFDDHPITTTTVTNVTLENSSANDKKGTWTRSIETRSITGPRPKCELDKDAPKPEAAKSGAPGLMIYPVAPCPPAQPDAKPHADTGKAKAAEAGSSDKGANSPLSGQAGLGVAICFPQTAAVEPKAEAKAENPAAGAKPTVNQTTVIAPPTAAAKSGSAKDASVNRASAGSPRRSILDRVLHRGNN